MKTLLGGLILLAAFLTTLPAAESTGDVTDVVQIRSLTQETGIYDRLWQPFLARWDDKQLLVTFGRHYDGTIDMGDVVCCRSPDNGATWKAPVPVFQSSLSSEGGVQYAYANSVLYHPPGQDIVWCFAMKCPRYYQDSEDSWLVGAFTADGGRSWHQVEMIVNYHSPLITNSGIVAVTEGGRTRYLMALTRNTLRHDPAGDRREFVLESTNLIVWNLAAYIPQEQPPQVFLQEGNIAEGEIPGELKMVMRTGVYAPPARTALNPPVAYSSVSRDGGRSWSLARPEPQLYNAIAKGFYGRDSLGRHIYVYNDEGPYVRKALRYVVQARDGAWSAPRTFFDGQVRNSYPTLIEDLTPGNFLGVWDSSNQIDRIRTSIRFGRLRLSDWQWRPLSSLPDPEGFSGAFAGVSGGALLFAGGSNFVGKRPWEGGSKSWYDTIFALPSPGGKWSAVGKLPRPNAYGVSATFGGEMICAGGGSLKENYSDVFALAWDGRAIHRRDLPPLPRRCAFCGGALAGDILYVAGGIDRPDSGYAMNNFWALDLRRPDSGWRQLESWPGVARLYPMGAAVGKTFYLLGGEAIRPNGKERPARTYLADAYAYTPGQGWRRLADMPHPNSGAASPAPVTPEGRIFIPSGDDGTRIMLDGPNHPGFRRDGILYDPKSDHWDSLPEGPISRATVPTAFWNGEWVIPGGERKPGYRTPEVWSVRLSD